MANITQPQKAYLEFIVEIGATHFTPQEWIEALELLLKLSKETLSEQQGDK